MNLLKYDTKNLRLVMVLGITQILAWGSTFYLPAILAYPISKDMGWSLSHTVGGLSCGMLLASLLAPLAGRYIDHYGGCYVLAFSSIMLSIGLYIMSLAPNLWMYYVSWSVLGIAMATGLYDAAFSTLGTLLGEKSRGAITGLTLIGGFASTLGWPIIAALESSFGWRETCFILGLTHLLVGLPIHYFLIPKKHHGLKEKSKNNKEPLNIYHKNKSLFLLVSGLLTIIAFIMATLSVHLLKSLQQLGIATATVLAIGMVIGPAQVAARILEYAIAQHLHPTWSARIGAFISFIGICLFIPGIPWLAFTGAALYGAGNGILTIARGTLPLALFGSKGYGEIMGKLARPMLFSQATGPFIVAFLMEEQGPLSMLTLMAILAFISIVFTLKIPK